MLGFVAAREEILNIAGNEMLTVNCSKRFSPALGIMSINGGGAVFVVKNEPELEAGVGDRNGNTALSGLVHRLSQVWMRVYVEHAPNLIEVLGAGPLIGAGSLNQGQRHHAASAPVKMDLRVTAGERSQVLALSYRSLSKNSNDSLLFSFADSSLWPTALGSLHSSTRSKPALSPPRSITGTAPNRPWR